MTILSITYCISVHSWDFFCLIFCVFRAQLDPWVTQEGTDPLPLEEEHCSAVEVTEEDIQNSVKFVPSLSAVVRTSRSSSRFSTFVSNWLGGVIVFRYYTHYHTPECSEARSSAPENSICSPLCAAAGKNGYLCPW